jgi:hypothetical protein
MDPETLELTFTVNEDQKIPLRFFARGQSYELWGLIPWDRHLIGPENPDHPMYLLGADRNGRDLLSRIIHGTRVSARAELEDALREALATEGPALVDVHVSAAAKVFPMVPQGKGPDALIISAP